MHLKQIILDGFKSYALETVFGPFDKNFNAITGTNGSGKSNSLDAICFVLGMNSSKLLRCNNLSQLIYKNGQAGINKATVTLIFDNTNKQTSPLGYEECDEIQVARTIFTNNTTKFTLNGHQIKLKSLHQLFASVNLNIATGSFLIQQGKIATILSASPKDILAQLEETAGTKMLEEAVDSAQKELARKDIRLKSIKDKIQTEIIPKLAELEKAREIGLKISKIQKGIKGIDTIMQINEIINKTNQLIQKTNKQENFQNRITNQNEIINNIQQQLKQKQEQIEEVQNLQVNQELLQQYDQYQLQIAQQDQKSQQLVQEFNQLQNEIKDLKNKIQNNQLSIEQNKQLLNQQQSGTYLIQQYQELLQQQSDLIQQIDLIENNQITSQILDNIQQLNSQIKKQIIDSCFKQEQLKPQQFLTQLQEQYSQQQIQIEMNTNKINNLNETINQYKIQQLQIDQEDKDMNRDFQLIQQKLKYQTQQLSQQLQVQQPQEQSIQSLRQYQQLCKNNINELREEQQNMRQQFTRGPKDYINQKNKLFSQFSQICFNKNNVSIAGMMKQIPDNIKNQFSLIGLVIDQINISQQITEIAKQYQVSPQLLLCCMEKIAGNKLFNIISGNVKQSQQFLKSQYCTKRCTILALDNMQFQLPDQRRQQLVRQKGGIIVSDLLEFNQNYKDIMQSLLGNLVICKDLNQAKEIAYDKQCYMKCITYNGDIVDPSGIITGGTKLSQNSYIDLYIQYNQLTYNGVSKQEVEQHEQQLLQLQQIFNNFSQQLQQYQYLQQKIQNSQNYQINNDIKQCDLQIQQLQQLNQNQQNVIQQYEITLQYIQQFIQNNNIQQLNQLQDNLYQVEQQIDNIKSQKQFINSQQYLQQKQQIQLQIQAKEQDIIELNNQLQIKQQQYNQMQDQIQQEEQTQKTILQQFTQTQNQVNQIREQKEQAQRNIKQFSKEAEQLSEQLNTQIKLLKQLQQEYQKVYEDQTVVQTSLQQLMAQHSEIISLISLFNNDAYQYLLNNMKIKANQQIQFETLIQLLSNIQNNYIDVDYQQQPEKIIKQLNKYLSNLDGIKQSLTKDIEVLSQQQPTSISITANLEELQQSSNKLIQMEQKIQEDKIKIQQLIQEVQERKLQALEDLYQEVDTSLRQIYQSLIPNAVASLQKVKKDDITAGVYLKTNMSGMSGGQKSLLALSFTLALLKSRPSPLYILDEIDAALDLSMTDNIGAMISKQFAGSQFLVISLKEGLFTKANKIFKVSYRDGSSRVEIVK